MPLVKKIEKEKMSSGETLPKVVLGVLFFFLVVLIIMGLTSCRSAKPAYSILGWSADGKMYEVFMDKKGKEIRREEIK